MKTIIVGLVLLIVIWSGCEDQNLMSPCDSKSNDFYYQFDQTDLKLLNNLSFNVELDSTKAQLFHMESRLDTCHNPYMLAIVGTPDISKLTGKGEINFQVVYQKDPNRDQHIFISNVSHKPSPDNPCYDSIFEMDLDTLPTRGVLNHITSCPVNNIRIFPTHKADVHIIGSEPKVIDTTTCLQAKPFSSGVLICTVEFH